jgi:hypothetical protein
MRPWLALTTIFVVYEPSAKLSSWFWIVPRQVPVLTPPA